MEREGHCKQISLACVGGVCRGWTTLGLPQPRVVCTSKVHTAQAPGWSMRALSQVGPEFHILPRSKPLRFSGAFQGHTLKWAMCFVPFPGPSCSGDQMLGKYTVPGGPCVLCTFLVPVTWFPGCPMRAQSQVCRASPLGNWSQSVTLLDNVNCPGSQEDVVSNWQPSHSLVEGVVSGAEIAVAPCLPALAVTHLHLCLPGGRALNSSWLVLLWYLLGHKPLFYKCARGHHKESELLEGKVLFPSFFLSPWQWYVLGYCVTLASSDCPQGIQAQSSS